MCLQISYPDDHLDIRRVNNDKVKSGEYSDVTEGLLKEVVEDGKVVSDSEHHLAQNRPILTPMVILSQSSSITRPLHNILQCLIHYEFE